MGLFAVWDGGLGIWGAIALAAVVGAWRVRRHGASPVQFMDAVAPALLVAQAIGRIGKYFNMYVAGAVALAGAAWFWRTQRRARSGAPGPAAAQAQPASASHHRP